jgi:tRNA pseudouridine38-40 synthase
MARLKLILAYRGTRYHGWQFQTPSMTWKGPIPPEGQGIPTVQEIVQRTLAGVVKHPVTLVGSSRTDAGVHAKGQLAHFDTDKPQIPPEKLRRAVNHRLPEDILIRSIESVPEDFSAIESTVSKRYQYFVWNAYDRPLFFADLVWHRWQPLDVEAMQQAARRLVGEHDFASFAKPGHGRDSTIRTVLGCDVTCRPPKLIIGVEGTGFLWQMVRIIVGTLVEVGLGRFTPDDVQQMVAARDRRAAGATAPPHGLYLQWIKTRNPAPATPQPPA